MCFWNVGLQTRFRWVVFFFSCLPLPTEWSSRDRLELLPHGRLRRLQSASLHWEAAWVSSGCKVASILPGCLAMSSHVLQSVPGNSPFPASLENRGAPTTALGWIWWAWFWPCFPSHCQRKESAALCIPWDPGQQHPCCFGSHSPEGTELFNDQWTCLGLSKAEFFRLSHFTCYVYVK